MKIKLKDYRISDIASFYGISTDTVRFYEKKGIFLPTEKSNTGYRVFSRSDVISLDYILKLRNMGIPLNDLARIINEDSPEETSVYITERIKKLNEDIQTLTEQKDALEGLKQELDKLTEFDDISVEYSPVLYLKEIKHSVAETREWLEKHGFNSNIKFISYSKKNMIDFDYETLNDVLTRMEITDMRLAVEIKPSEIEKVKEVMEAEDIIWPSQLCVHTKVKAVYNSDHIFYDLNRMREFCESHNFRANGPSISIIMYKEKIQSKGITYFDLWSPTK